MRLTVKSQTREEVVLLVAGWIAGRDVALLEQEGAGHRREGRRLVLDLQEARFIDRDGLTLLARWAGPGLVLRGGSPFVRLLLQRQGLL